jgi:hypothetical protein
MSSILTQQRALPINAIPPGSKPRLHMMHARAHWFNNVIKASAPSSLLPGLATCHHLASCCMQDAVHRAAESGSPELQVVALGAGFDTRPWLPDLQLSSVRTSWFAVDREEVSNSSSGYCCLRVLSVHAHAHVQVLQEVRAQLRSAGAELGAASPEESSTHAQREEEEAGETFKLQASKLRCALSSRTDCMHFAAAQYAIMQATAAQLCGLRSECASGGGARAAGSTAPTWL